MATPGTYYISTSIPYVNGEPHIGFALEAIQSDTLARHHRQRGDATFFLSGTDENSLTNVQAAEREGIPVRELVDRNAARFKALQEPLHVSYDDFIRTASDERHLPGAQALWNACVEAGDIYSREYQGLFCVRCERFYKTEELVDGKCPVHAIELEAVDEVNYFFRLSAYGDRLREIISSNELLIQPEHRREEVLSFIESGLEDFSISRQSVRGRGWGVPVPNDPDQVMYTWVDALSNYITALGYGWGGENYTRFWVENPNRVHIIGKDIIRFHAIYWPALLLSANVPLPTVLNVHEFLLHDGQKMSKSLGNVVDPVELVEAYGNDAVRFWMLREMPRSGDGNFSVGRLIDRYNQDLANDLGNLANRSINMVHRYREGVVPTSSGAREADAELYALTRDLNARVEAALDAFDFRTALAAIWELVTRANRYVDEAKPWEVAKAARGGDSDANARLDGILADLVETLRIVTVHIAPFIPQGAARLRQALGISREEDAVVPAEERGWTDALAGTSLPKPAPIFPRIEVEDGE